MKFSSCHWLCGCTTTTTRLRGVIIIPPLVAFLVVAGVTFPILTPTAVAAANDANHHRRHHHHREDVTTAASVAAGATTPEPSDIFSWNEWRQEAEQPEQQRPNDDTTTTGAGPDPNRVIVTFKEEDGVVNDAISRLNLLKSTIQRGGGTAGGRSKSSSPFLRVHHQFDHGNAVAVSMSPGDVRALRSNPSVLSVEKDVVRYPDHLHRAGTYDRDNRQQGRRRRRRRRRQREQNINDINDINNSNINNNKNKNSGTYWSKNGGNQKLRRRRTSRRRHRRLDRGQVVPYGIRTVQANRLKLGDQRNITVCVMDTGYDLGHEDLVRRNSGLVSGYKGPAAPADLPWTEDRDGHGTHVTGTIAAVDNDAGIVGVAPGVSLYVVRIFGDSGIWAYASDVAHAVRTCRERGNADVINMSLGGLAYSSFEDYQLQRVYDAGTLLAASAGNGGFNIVRYPAGYPSVISVAAVDRKERVAQFSQTNNRVELAAPGVNILSTVSFPMPDITSVEILSTTVGDGGGTGNDNNVVISGRVFLKSATGNVTGRLRNCGDGSARICTNAKGKICVMRRNLAVVDFPDQVFNCQESGGIAAVIYNDVGGPCSNEDLRFPSDVPTLCVRKSEGRLLKQAARDQRSANVIVEFAEGGASSRRDGYAYFDGTSMATPHVAGAAALVWTHFADCNHEQVRAALTQTAKDKGPPGRDEAYGYGIVQARDAHEYLEERGCDGGGRPG